MHKIAFLGRRMRASRAIYALYLKFLIQRNLVAEFTCKSELAILSHLFSGGGLRGNVYDSSLACWKADSRLSIGYS